MKKMRNILVLTMTLALLVCVLSGCESTADKIAALSGTWTMVEADTEEQALELLENIEAYDEEIALADLGSLEYVQIVTFTQEQTYSFGYDVEATRDCVKTFYDNYFAALFQSRATLNEAYGTEFDAMTQEEFLQFYADLYGFETYEALLTHITDVAYDYEGMQTPWETGTYTIKGDDIMCTIDGQTQAESLGYAIDGSTLTLTYSNAVEVYTREN